MILFVGCLAAGLSKPTSLYLSYPSGAVASSYHEPGGSASYAVAPVITASSSQVFQRNYNTLLTAPVYASARLYTHAVTAPYVAAPVVAAPYFAAPAVAASYFATPAVATAPFLAAPASAAPQSAVYPNGASQPAAPAREVAPEKLVSPAASAPAAQSAPPAPQGTSPARLSSPPAYAYSYPQPNYN